MTISNSSDLNVKDITFLNDIKSVAVIGASKNMQFRFLRGYAELFKGKVYAINPKLKNIPEYDNVEVYPSLLDIPGPVDYVYFKIPANGVLDVMDQCVEKGVKLVSLFTSDFSDSGTQEGLKREKELLRKAKNKVRILGPNCLGLHYPKLGLSWRDEYPPIKGNIGFVSQSGGLCNYVIMMTMELGLNISKAFSFGNGADLDFVDILSFLSNDTETDIILCYLEGIKPDRGKVLQKVLERNKKPIIMVKGGRTSPGARATKTHTASISGENKLWSAIFNQYNIIEVESLEQMVHVAYLIEHYGFFNIEKMAVVSASGGYGVILTDLVERAGIEVPPFSPHIQEKLDSGYIPIGSSSQNPLDLASILFFSNEVKRILEIALSDENIDGLIMDLPSFYFNDKVGFGIAPNFEQGHIETTTLGYKHNKPLIPIVQRYNTPVDQERLMRKIAEYNVPVFTDPLQVIPLLPKISKYSRNRKKLENSN